MNGQQILEQRRQQEPKRDTPRHISQIDPHPTQREFYEPPATRETERVRLDTLNVGHHPKVAYAVRMARLWAQRKQEHGDASMILCGPYGTGKTHIAKSILWSICYTLDDGTVVAPVGKFFVANDLIQLLDGSAFARDLIGNIPVLVIDDVGSEQQIEYAGNEERQRREVQNRYFKVIDYCYSYQISVILTSNYTIDEIKLIVGGRAWDRLSQMAPRLNKNDVFIVDMFGVPSYRQKESGR